VSSRTLWSLVLQPLLQPEPLRRGPSRPAWRRTRDRHRTWDEGEYLVPPEANGAERGSRGMGRETSLGPPPRGTRARVCSCLIDERFCAGCWRPCPYRLSPFPTGGAVSRVLDEAEALCCSDLIAVHLTFAMSLSCSRISRLRSPARPPTPPNAEHRPPLRRSLPTALSPTGRSRRACGPSFGKTASSPAPRPFPGPPRW
jgi:hypothetical protein